MNLKLLQNEQFKKAAKPTGDLVWNKILIKLKKPQKRHQRIIQKQKKE